MVQLQHLWPIVNAPEPKLALRVLDYYEHALSAGGDPKAAAYLECEIAGPGLFGELELIQAQQLLR
ncbi:2-isopropylmalate synthase [Candidatus Planktophila sp.]|nr:2-isopropylmalate synthase [Candidatus Planktophila sp.]